MFEILNQNLTNAFKTLSGQTRITEINVASTIKAIRRALLDADVSYGVAREVADSIKAKAIGTKIQLSVSPGQMLTQIVADELTMLMGKENAPLNLSGNPACILLAGLQGSGKTTLSAKLALHLKSLGRSVLLVGCDVYRPAAREQLKTLAEQINVPVYIREEDRDVAQIARKGMDEARSRNINTVIIDTAGRLAVDEAMMEEIGTLKSELLPQEILYVADSMTGQDAVTTAKAFHERIDFSGVVLTKLDGEARGGAALSIYKAVEKPIKFIGTGERVEDIDIFHPDRMAKRILGMGDVLSFVEKARTVFDEEETREIEKKIRKSQFGMDDLLKQIKKFEKLGGMANMVSLIPGMSKMGVDEGKVKKNVLVVESLINSMTQAERQDPSIISGTRKDRIVRGSGRATSELNGLIKNFGAMKKMLHGKGVPKEMKTLMKQKM